MEEISKINVDGIDYNIRDKVLDEKLTELAGKVEELDRGEAYIEGDKLTFRNWADAAIEGETLKL